MEELFKDLANHYGESSDGTEVSGNFASQNPQKLKISGNPADPQKLQISGNFASQNPQKLKISGNTKHLSTHVDLIDKQIKSLYQKVIAQESPTFSLKFLNPCYQPEHLINHYFDQIYVLNLDARPDRMTHMQQGLHNLGIYNYARFPALYGKEPPHLGEWEKYSRVPMTRLERTKYQRKGIGTPGSWAILKSMYLMIRDAKQQGHEKILVLQDDLLFHKEFHQRFNNLVKHANFPKSWKLFYIGATQHSWSHAKFDRSGLFYHPSGTADGAFGVGIHSSVYDELINEILEFDLPVDSGALKRLQRRYPKDSIVSFPNLVIADIRDSDLRGYRNLENFSKKFRWNLKEYHVVDNLVKFVQKNSQQDQEW